jgi:hypothetical protein
MYSNISYPLRLLYYIYIYRSINIIQYNQPLYTIYSSYSPTGPRRKAAAWQHVRPINIDDVVWFPAGLLLRLSVARWSLLRTGTVHVIIGAGRRRFFGFPRFCHRQPNLMLSALVTWELTCTPQIGVESEFWTCSDHLHRNLHFTSATPKLHT